MIQKPQNENKTYKLYSNQYIYIYIGIHVYTHISLHPKINLNIKYGK